MERSLASDAARFMLKGAGVVLLVVLSGCGKGAPEGEAAVTIRQRETARVFDLEAVSPERLPVPYLMHPLVLSIHDEHLYVLDYGDLRLKRFTPEGAPAGVLINGRGEGPGELQNPVDFAVAGDTVWVLDPNPRRIAVYRTDGAFVRNLPTVDLAIRMARTGPHFILLTLMSPTLLLKIDAAGREVARFDHPLEEQTMNRLALDGALVPAPDGGFFYLPRFTGQFFRHAADGRLLKHVWTIDAFPLPERGDGMEDGVVRAPRGEPVRTDGGYLYGDELHLRTLFRDRLVQGYRGVIDRYEAATGVYRGSIGIPEQVRGAVVYDDALYGLADTTIVRFRLETRRAHHSP